MATQLFRKFQMYRTANQPGVGKKKGKVNAFISFPSFVIFGIPMKYSGLCNSIKLAGLIFLFLLSVSVSKGEVVSVATYGAVGDGSTDDTDAIQDAIDACPANGTLYFPTGTYRTDELDLDPSKPIVIDGNYAVLQNYSSTPDYIFGLSYSGSTFIYNYEFKNIIFAGNVNESMIYLEGGAFSSFNFENIKLATGSGNALIALNNNTTSPVRNPSSFRFRNILTISGTYKYQFYYYGGAGNGFDSFHWDQLIHWTNQTGGACIKIEDGSGSYCSLKNVYTAGYADPVYNIATDGAIAFVRSVISNILHEGTADNGACLGGYYQYCDIKNLNNYVDTSTYSGNQAINAKLQNCKVFAATVQDASSGVVSTAGVTLVSSSKNNAISACEYVYGGNQISATKSDELTKYEDVTTSVSSSSTNSIVNFSPNDFEVGDELIIELSGYGTGANPKAVQLYEIGACSLSTVASSLTTGSFVARVRYRVYDNAGTKSVRRIIEAWNGTSKTVSLASTTRTFTTNINFGLYITCGSWSGNTVEIEGMSIIRRKNIQ